MKLVLKSVLQIFLVCSEETYSSGMCENSKSTTNYYAVNFVAGLYLMPLPNIALALVPGTVALAALPKGIAAIAVASGARSRLTLL